MASINKTRGLLYLLARILGDINAIGKRKPGKRIVRRAISKVTDRGIGRLFK